ncbi:MAG: glutathione peroxidase [Planctomycetia bacterium]|nr:glutathione peroxidase [Planctomycetia bacterium]
MRVLYLCAVAALAGFPVACNGEDKKVTNPLEHKLTDIDDKEYDLSKLKGKVILIVNVASECGFTPQYKGLQELFDKYEKDGLVVIGIPSNEFNMQEPGTNAEIKKFCTTKFKVTFPMMAKVVIKGKNQIPLYKTLIEATPNKDGEVEQVSWNFEKFLISREGKVVGRFKPDIEPMSDEVVKAVKTELEKPKP